MYKTKEEGAWDEKLSTNYFTKAAFFVPKHLENVKSIFKT